jgi:hypothetical protein
MDRAGFAQFLKRGGRSPNATARCIRCVEEFEGYLQTCCRARDLEEAGPEELASFVAWLEQTPKASAKTHLWALRYYYEHAQDEAMRNLASALREDRIKRTPFSLRRFRGVNHEHTDRLAAAGVKNVKQMLRAGRTPSDRRALADKSSVPLETIVELVTLSDLARVPGIKGIRARLYYNAGVDRLEKLAESDPAELRSALVEFVEETGFDGIAPLPKEIEFAVETARHLPKIVEC